MKFILNKFLILNLLTVFFACNHPESESFYHKDATQQLTKKNSSQNYKTYKVIGVKDGDTVELLIESKSQVVRLAHIDCPEKKQPFGNNAKQFVSDLCFGKSVRIYTNGKKDRYKRLIAEIILGNGKNINKELVKNGLAWHFKKYSKDNSYDILEKHARKLKLGLWKDKTPIAPWDWRKKKKIKQKLPQKTKGCRRKTSLIFTYNNLKKST